nr:hypothetical protein [Aldersonia kunmingensis]
MAAPAEARPIGPTLDNLTPRAAAALVRQHLDPADTREFLRSSPAKLAGVGIIAMVLCVIAGVVTALTAAERSAGLDEMLTETEPFSVSAQQLYSALSVADAAASTAFISGGIEPPAVRAAYLQALGSAAASTTGSAAGDEPPGSPARVELSSIAAQLPTYAGLVETARADNRIGLPVGASYLGEASHLMQATVLPLAEQLYEQRSEAVEETLNRFDQPPWLALTLLALSLITLAFAQFYLLRRWRRVFNPGLVVASLAMLIMVLWVGLATSLAAADTHEALDDGAIPTDMLTSARIYAQQARSAETLKLSRRDTSGQYDQAFDQKIDALRGVLANYPSDASGSGILSDARQQIDAWVAAHNRMNDAFARTDYSTAVAIAVGPGDDDSMAHFEALDDDLEQGIAETRDELRADTSRAARALQGVVPGAFGLAAIAVLCVVVGMIPRLREYR